MEDEVSVLFCQSPTIEVRIEPCEFSPYPHTFLTSFEYYLSPMFKIGRGSSVSIATGYGLDGPGIESRWRRDFPHLSRPALGPTQPPVQWVPALSRGAKSGRGVTLTPSPPSSAVVKKG